MDQIKKSVTMTTVIVFIVAFLLGYGTSSRIVNRNQAGGPGYGDASKTAEISPASSLADTSASVGDTDTSVTADDQPFGNAVAVAVKIAKESWVAIHEDTNGKPGNILGAQIFPPGEHLGKIDLLRGTDAGKKYYAMLHADNGDRAFDYTVDMPLMNESEESAMDAFTATTNPPAQQ